MNADMSKATARASQIVTNYLRDIGAGVDEFSHYEDELVAQIDAFAASERASDFPLFDNSTRRVLDLGRRQSLRRRAEP